MDTPDVLESEDLITLLDIDQDGRIDHVDIAAFVLFHTAHPEILEKFLEPAMKRLEENGMMTVSGADVALEPAAEPLKAPEQLPATPDGVVVESVSLKPAFTVSELAKKWNTKEETIKKKLVVGSKIEREHTEDDKTASTIASQHIWEDLEYYEKLAKVGLDEATGDLNKQATPLKGGDRVIYNGQTTADGKPPINGKEYVIAAVKNGKTSKDAKRVILQGISGKDFSENAFSLVTKV